MDGLTRNKTIIYGYEPRLMAIQKEVTRYKTFFQNNLTTRGKQKRNFRTLLLKIQMRKKTLKFMR